MRTDTSRLDEYTRFGEARMVVLTEDEVYVVFNEPVVTVTQELLPFAERAGIEASCFKSTAINASNRSKSC